MQQGIEYDSAYSNSLRAEVDAELMRIGLMSPADAAAAAVDAVEKAEAAIAVAEEAETEALEAERDAEEAKAYAEELKKKLSEKKARLGKISFNLMLFMVQFYFFVLKMSLLKISVVLHYHLSRYDCINFFKSTLFSYSLF